MTHYFKTPDQMPTDRRENSFRFLGLEMHFVTADGVFSKSKPDQGSLLLAETAIGLSLGSSVMDLGCGYGLVGQLVKKSHPSITLHGIDVNALAVDCAIASAQRNQLSGTYWVADGTQPLPQAYDTILLNPPIRAGKATVYALYANAKAHLNAHGQLVIVIRKQQGAASTLTHLQTLFPVVERLAHHKGYEILRAIND